MAKINPIEVQKYLKGVDYPASRDDILKKAQEHGADEELFSSLEQLPDEEYDTPAAVNKALGKLDS